MTNYTKKSSSPSTWDLNQSPIQPPSSKTISTRSPTYTNSSAKINSKRTPSRLRSSPEAINTPFPSIKSTIGKSPPIGTTPRKTSTSIPKPNSPFKTPPTKSNRKSISPSTRVPNTPSTSGSRSTRRSPVRSLNSRIPCHKSPSKSPYKTTHLKTTPSRETTKCIRSSSKKNSPSTGSPVTKPSSRQGPEKPTMMDNQRVSPTLTKRIQFKSSLINSNNQYSLDESLFQSPKSNSCSFSSSSSSSLSLSSSTSSVDWHTTRQPFSDISCLPPCLLESSTKNQKSSFNAAYTLAWFHVILLHLHQKKLRASILLFYLQHTSLPLKYQKYLYKKLKKSNTKSIFKQHELKKHEEKKLKRMKSQVRRNGIYPENYLFFLFSSWKYQFIISVFIGSLIWYLNWYEGMEFSMGIGPFTFTYNF